MILGKFTTSFNIFLMLVLAFVTCTAYAGTSYTWNGGTSTAWATATNWTPNGNPGSVAGDVVTIATATRQPVLTITPANALASLTFSPTNATALSLTITGVTLQVLGAVTLNSLAGFNAACTLTGTGNLTCVSFVVGTTVVPSLNRTTLLTFSLTALTVTNNITINSSYSAHSDNCTFTYSNGTVTAAGITTITPANSASSFTMAAGSATLQLTGSTPFTIGAGGTNTITLNGTGATVDYQSTSNVAFLGAPSGLLAYTNLIISGGGGNIKTLGANTTVSAGLTVRAASTLAMSTFTLGTPTSLILETVGGGNGSAIIGSGSLTLGGNVTVNYTGTGSIINGASIGSPVSLSATRTFTVVDDGASDVDFSISGIISGAFGITKAGSGSVMNISGLNTYTGVTTISAGTLQLGSASALGTVAGNTTISTGAVLDLNGINYSAAEPLTINGTGISNSGAVINSSSTGATFAGLITLGSASSIVGNTGPINLSNIGTITGAALGLTLGGAVGGTLSSILGTGTGTLTIAGGTWLISGANTYTGTTNITSGTLQLGSTTALGGAGAGSTIITGGAVLDLNGINYSNNLEALTVNGTGISGSGAVINSSTTGATFPGLLTLVGPSSIIAGSGTINISNAGTITGATFGLTLGGAAGGTLSSILGTGSGTLTKVDAGTWTLSGASTYTGLTTISAGTIKLGATGTAPNSPLGTIGSGTVVNAGASLDLNGYTLPTAEPLTINGSGVSSGGALLNSSATAATYNGALTVATASSIGTTGNITLGVNGITGGKDLTKVGTGTLSLGSGSVTLGSLFINVGTLVPTSGTMNIAVNFTNNGTFTAIAGLVTFNGGTSQNILGTSISTFNNLTLSNTFGLVLGGSVNAAVNGTLTFSNGIISTGTNTLVLGNGATVSGAGTGKYVNGNLQKGIATGTTSKTFEIGDASAYTPVILALTASTNNTGNITVYTTPGDHPQIATSDIDPSLSVNRYWTITNNGVSGITPYSATFTFVSTDVNTGANTSNFIIQNFIPSTWTSQMMGSTLSLSTQATGITLFGDFQIGDPAAVPSPCLYSDDGNVPTIADVMPCVNFPTNTQTISTTFASHQYFTMNVIQGITYEAFTCNTTAPASPIMLTVYREGAPASSPIAFSYTNASYCSGVLNNCYVSFTPTFSGKVRVLVNKKRDCSSGLLTGIAIVVNALSGGNTLDDQTTSGSNTWVGHLYDGTNNGVLFNGNFTNYLGDYSEPELFDESFGGNTNCFTPVLSNDTSRASLYTETFSVRYRMLSTRKGLYTVNLGSDDGGRLAIDGTLAYNNWSDQAYSIKSNVLISLTGSSSLLYDYYENGGANEVSFANLTQLLANNLTTNTTQYICLGNSGLTISGDAFGTLPTGITLSGTGYQWTYSTTPLGTRTSISGATGATFTPSSAVAPFNTAGTYYIYRNALLSSINNVAPNPYVATNESNAASITVTTLPSATISYAGTPFCKNLGTGQPVTINGTAGGSYSAAPAGLSIDGLTGAITPSTSTVGAYTVTYTIAAAGGCGIVTATTPVTITAVPTAAISYAGSPFCTSVSTPQSVTISGTGAYTGGIYSSTAGLTINSGTGAISPNSSTAGTYTVTYTIPASGGCLSVPVTTLVTITTLPIGTFSYTGTPYCQNASNPLPTFSGGGIAGTFSSTGGLVFISTTTGQVNLAASTTGTYTVTNTIAASGGCSQVIATSPITITTLPSATISYAGTPFCKSLGTSQPVTRTGTAGGSYSASPSGLTIDAATGAVTPGTSTAGAYTVTYTIAATGGCGIVTATTPVTITAVPTAMISYAGSPFCTSISTPQSVTISGTGAYTGGIYSSTAGLTINSGTGAISPNSSTAGTYTVTYTIPASGGCLSVPVTTLVTITTLPIATFSYTGTPYCQNASNPLPTFSGGGVAGTFSSTVGLVFISTTTGQVNLAASTTGTYTVTNTIAAAGGCALVSATNTITITTLPSATISYAGTPFCKSLGTSQPVTRTGTAGGSYSASPSGLTIDAVTGAITPGTSTAGAYTVTYTLAAVGGCGIVTATTPVTITAVPTATISYSGSPYCTSISIPQSVTISGTDAYTGGVYSSTAGLTINSGTGAITPSSSTAGTYTVTYTIPASGGCASVPVTTLVTITTLPIATFSYTGTPYCQNASNPLPTFSGGGVAGTFSSTVGLVFISTTTGQVNLAASTTGTYTVTNTIAASGGCSQIISTSSITINPMLTASVTISANPSGTICAGTSVTFTALPTNGGSSPTYQWKKNGLNVGTSSTTYTDATLNNGDIITCVLTSNATCVTNNPATSNAINMTINAPSIGGTITGVTSPLCLGTGTGTLTLVGYTGTIIRWERQLNSGGWSSVGNAGSPTYSETPYAAGTWQYRVVVQNGICLLGYSSIATVSVDPNTVAGYISGSSTPICQGASTGTMTIIGSTGSVIRWEKRVNSGSWTNISITLLTYSEVPSSGGTWEYRALIQSGSCPSAYTTSFSMTVIPTLTITLGANPVICVGTTTAYLPYTATTGSPNLYSIIFDAAAHTAGLSDVNGYSLPSSPIPINVPWNIAPAVYNGTLTVLTSYPVCNSIGYPITITVQNNAQPSAITGNTTPCLGSSQTYSVTNVSGVVYTWTFPAGWIQTGGGTTNSVTVTVGAGSGNVQVTPAYQCGTGPSQTLAVVVNSGLPVSVAISANPSGAICAGTSVTFTAVPTNGGSSPTYQWKKNGLNVGTSSTTYTDAALNNGDAVTCVLTSNIGCASNNPATSNVIAMTVNPILPVSVSITASPGSVICAGTSVTFTAVPTNGGSSPIYQWQKNGTNVGSNSPIYQDATLINNDVITCMLTSNIVCPSGNPATSNSITMSVNPVLPVSILISANPAGPICLGTSVTFTATPVNGGTSPIYQWTKNGINVGANSPVYTDASLMNNDAIMCTLTSNITCPTGNPAPSNTIVMVVNPLFPVSVSITANPSGAICSGTSVTFTAAPINGGSSPAYQWRKNGVNVGTSSTIYTDAGLANGNVISCILTSNATCATNNPASSNPITMTVNPTPVSPTSAVANPSSIYSNYPGTIILSATGGGTGNGDVLKWYAGGCGLGTSIGSGNPLTIAAPYVTTTYYARWENGTCNSACTNTQVTVMDVYRSRATGNWSDLTTWEVYTNQGLTWIPPTHIPTSTDGTITIMSPHVVTVTPATGNINVDELTINPGGKLVVNVCPSGYWFNIVDGPGTDITVNGTMEYQDDAVQLLNGATMSVGSGGKYQANMNYSGNYPITIPSASWDPNSTCEILSSNQLVPAAGLSQTFGNFTWNYSGQTTTLNLGGALQNISGNFTVSSTGSASTLQLTSTTNLTLNIGNDLIIQNGILDFSNGATTTKIINLSGNYNQSGGTFTNSNANPLTVNFKGTGKTFTQSAGTLTSSYINWNVNSGASLALLNNLPVSASRSCQVNGTLDCGILTSVSGTGSFNLATGGTLIIGSPDGITQSSGTGNVQTSVRSFSTGANYIYDGTSPQSTGNGLPVIVNNLTINNSNNVTLTGSSGVNGALSLTNGVFSIGHTTFVFQNSNTPILRTSGTITTDTATNLTFGNIGNTAGAAFTIPAGTFTSPPTINNMTINRDNLLTLNSQPLGIKGILLCNGPFNCNNNLTLLSTSTQTALIDGSGTGQVMGTVVMQRYLPKAFGYKYVSSPFSSVPVSQFAPYIDLTASFPTFYRYDESLATDWWVNYTNPTGLLIPTQGYVANFGPGTLPATVSLNGTVNNGTFTTSTLYNHNYPFTQGFNLIGNPYPSPIDWNAASGWTRVNTDNAIYYFNTGDSSEYVGTYSSYINGISSDGIANNIIPAMQGFFIHVSNGSFPVAGTITFSNPTRSNILNPVFHSPIQEESIPLLRFTAGFESNPGNEDPMVIYLDNTASWKFDKDFDAIKLMNTDWLVPNVYAVSSDALNLSIYGLPPFSDTINIVPIGLETEKSGWVTFHVRDLENFPSNLNVYLADSKSVVIQNLLRNNEVRVNLDAGQYNGRFSLIFSLKDLQYNPGSNQNIYAYSFEETLYIYTRLDPGEKGFLTVYNMLGQPVYNSTLCINGFQQLPMDLKPGVYVVSLSSSKGNYIRKVFFNEK